MLRAGRCAAASAAGREGRAAVGWNDDEKDHGQDNPEGPKTPT